MPVDNLVIIGIGGTGAKIVEAVIQLAASSNAPKNIYPVLIDQDVHNGNVTQCKNSIDEYLRVRDKTVGIVNSWAFKPIVEKIDDRLLPLVPENQNKNFRAAIGEPNMNMEERSIIESLFIRKQLDEILDKGYKKRAHIGSVLMGKLLSEEDKKDDSQPGLKKIISKIKQFGNIHIAICGSIFGGTGASGITNVGRYFQENIPNAIIKGVILTPYFKVSDKFGDNDEDQGIVKSDADMQMVKIAIEMYENNINEAFDHVYILGSEIQKVTDDQISEFPCSGGEKQKNPAHIFELIAASATMINDSKQKPQPTKYFMYVVQSQNEIPCFQFTFKDLPDVIHISRLKIMHDFSHLLCDVEDEKQSWKDRQPWIAQGEPYKDYGILFNWAKRHNDWWREMSNKLYKSHVWREFGLEDIIINDKHKYEFSALLSQNLQNKQAKLISDVLYSLNKLVK